MRTDHRLAPFRYLPVVWWCLLPAMASGAETAPATAPATASGVEPAPAAAVVPLGPGVSVDLGKREAYLDAAVSLGQGILEYMICRKHTFEHEAVFVTEAQPSLLHTALLLITAEPIGYSPTDDWPAQLRRHPASALDVEVEFMVGDTRQRRPLSRFARNRERQDGVVSDHWTFAGSFFHVRDGKEYYAADSAGGVIGLTPKGASVVQYGDRTGVPYHGDDQGLECNEATIPAAGTAVRVIFRVHAPTVVPAAPATPAVEPPAVGPVTQDPTTLSGKP